MYVYKVTVFKLPVVYHEDIVVATSCGGAVAKMQTLAAYHSPATVQPPAADHAAAVADPQLRRQPQDL